MMISLDFHNKFLSRLLLSFCCDFCQFTDWYLELSSVCLSLSFHFGLCICSLYSALVVCIPSGFALSFPVLSCKFHSICVLVRSIVILKKNLLIFCTSLFLILLIDLFVCFSIFLCFFPSRFCGCLFSSTQWFLYCHFIRLCVIFLIPASVRCNFKCTLFVCCDLMLLNFSKWWFWACWLKLWRWELNDRIQISVHHYCYQ